VSLSERKSLPSRISKSKCSEVELGTMKEQVTELRFLKLVQAHNFPAEPVLPILDDDKDMAWRRANELNG
jgi:hypothetical protein